MLDTYRLRFGFVLYGEHAGKEVGGEVSLVTQEGDCKAHLDRLGFHIGFPHRLTEYDSRSDYKIASTLLA